MSNVAPPSNDRFTTLRSLSFLQGMDDEQIRLLSELANEAEFAEGTLIFSECQAATHCYLIVSGSVLLEICGPDRCTTILTIGPGELLGWSTLLGSARLTASARCLETTRSFEFDGTKLLALCDANPSFGYQLMRCVVRTLSGRLTATRLQMLDLFRA